ncbi:MAG: Arm DNA-binding domain-containing protein, partial [Synergistaceae bacterium]|nr:Arm DNA-binding domain-containing protein [Synergistaceae bacterium]
MALTELICKQARAEEKTYTMADGRGLMLEIRPNGGKYWIVRYWVAGKEKRTSLGKFPDISVREARDKNIDFRRSLASGKPVGFEEETFSSVAAEWL